MTGNLSLDYEAVLFMRPQYGRTAVVPEHLTPSLRLQGVALRDGSTYVEWNNTHGKEIKYIN